MNPIFAWVILGCTAAVLAVLIPFALHRTHLLRLARRPPVPTPPGWEGPLPRVAVQLPVYNEAGVVVRLLDAAAALEYPRDLLEIQLLDDSTDGTSTLARERIEYWRERGVEIRHIRRGDRAGFKAGALAHGVRESNAEFFFVLDADFLPGPGVLRRLLPPFQDPGVGVVQARWDHLNEGSNLLTRCQALLLDAHFHFEQGGRSAGGLFMNFNGTAGIWRREALDDAGGWSADTLTEDLDASYRAQMRGWRFVFLPGVGVPAEVPEEVGALDIQQRRWAQGGIETGRKILPALFRSRWSRAIKVEAAIHLLGHLAHPLTLALGLLLLPSAVARRALGLEGLLVLDLVVFGTATGSFLLFYLAAGRTRRRPWSTLIPTTLATLAMGIGLTASVSGAVLRGALGRGRDTFLRTPKRGDGPVRYPALRGTGALLFRWFLTGWMGVSWLLAFRMGIFTSLPFLTLFGTGYGWLAVQETMERLRWKEGVGGGRDIAHVSPDSALRGSAGHDPLSPDQAEPARA